MRMDVENMSRHSQLIAIACLFAVVFACEAEEDPVILENNESQDDLALAEGNSSGNLVEDAIRAFERPANAVLSAEERSVLPSDEIENLVNRAVKPLELILHLLNDPTNIYRFIEAKGIQRVIVPLLHVPNDDLRGNLLSLILVLFEFAPTTTTVMVPMGVLDKLLDIFEDDDNMAHKAKTMDILNVWLPENPKAQARVMKLKGLEPFYIQARKLDDTVMMNTQLKLFSKILKEHIAARDNQKQRTITDATQINIYKKIGLIESISTVRICHGFLDIFKNIWNSPYRDIFMFPVFAILSDLEPYCVGHYGKSEKALQLCQDLLKYLKEGGDEIREHYEVQGLNIEETVNALQTYVDKLTPSIHNEF